MRKICEILIWIAAQKDLAKIFEPALKERRTRQKGEAHSKHKSSTFSISYTEAQDVLGMPMLSFSGAQKGLKGPKWPKLSLVGQH